MDKKTSQPRIAFFGTPQFAVYVLDALKEKGVVPDLIVTAVDKPAGRNLVLTPPPAKLWAEENDVDLFQTEKLDENMTEILKEGEYDLYIVAAFGFIIPKDILDIPKHGTLNVHPSLLPRLRGASPLQSAILEEDKTGVSIMLLDEQMDHGPIVAQEEVAVSPWPPKESDLEKLLGTKGGEILADTIPEWTTGNIEAKEQDHESATYTQKIKKSDGLIELDGDAEKNFRKIQAYNTWPRAHFFVEKNEKQIRVIVTEAHLANGMLIIDRVIPEGKKEMDYEIFLN